MERVLVPTALEVFSLTVKVMTSRNPPVGFDSPGTLADPAVRATLYLPTVPLKLIEFVPLVIVPVDATPSLRRRLMPASTECCRHAVRPITAET
jgi:hypothetical protein